MNKCQHNQKISLFCINEHCEWKQAGGCEKCIKKYHNHVGNAKLLSEQEVEQLLKKFVIDHAYKHNCRAIQQAIYAYFGTLKTQLISSLELICKTFITQLGSPYLFQNHIFTVHKRIKSKDYRKINQKDFRKLYEISKKFTGLSPSKQGQFNEAKAFNDYLSKEDGKIYKQQLKKNQKFLTHLEGVMISYEGVLKQVLQNFKHDKVGFDGILKLIKETLQEKTIKQKISKEVKDNEIDLFHQNLSTRLSTSTKQSKSQISSHLSSTLQKKSTKQQNHYKMGIKNFQLLQKPLTSLKNSQQPNDSPTKRVVSLDKKLSVLNPSKPAKDFLFDNNDYKIQGQKKRIYFAETISSGPKDRFLQPRDNSGQKSNSLTKKQYNGKQDEIAVRKQQLIEIMKNHSNRYQKVLYNNKKNNENLQSEGKSLANDNQINTNSPKIIINEADDRKKSFLLRKDSITEERRRPVQLQEGNNSHSLSPPRLPDWQVRSIKYIEPIQQIQLSQQSLDVIKKLVTKTNTLYAHSRLPYEDRQQKQKQIGHSRVVIVPTDDIKKDDCHSPLLRRKVQAKLLKDSPTKTSPQKMSKSALNDNEEKSLGLLLKAINCSTDEAIGLLEEAIIEANNNLSAAQYLSFLYLENSQPHEALLVCNNLLQKYSLNKANEEVLLTLENNKAASLNMLGRYSQSIVLLEKCIKIKEKDILYKNFGDAYYQMSNYQKSTFYYQKCLRLNPLSDQAAYNLSVCLYLQANYHNAKLWIYKAIELKPDPTEYQQLKRQIEIKLNQLTKNKRID